MMVSRSGKWWKVGDVLTLAVATGFGLGYSPIASGTAGTLLGIVIVVLLKRVVPLPLEIIVAVLLAVLAVPFCGRAEEIFGRKDDGRIVADEYLTFPLCMLGLPPSPLMLVVAFITNRVSDIIKPPPARAAQEIHGGVGVVLDDVIASLYSLAMNHLIYWLIISRLSG